MLDDVSVIMLILMAVAGAVGVLAIAFSLNIDRRRKLAASIVMLFLYILYVVFTVFVYLSFNYDSVVLYFSVMLIALAGTGYVIYRCVKEKQHMQWMALLLFLCYCVLVVTVTILIRRGTETMAVNMIPFTHVIKAINTGSMKSLEGDILNILLFVPFGFLLPQINKQVFRKAIFVLILGFAASTIIETIQLMFHLGYCDINDIITNSLGAVIGYWISKAVRSREMETVSASDDQD